MGRLSSRDDLTEKAVWPTSALDNVNQALINQTDAGFEIARLLAGDIVGEISFVDSKSLVASVVAARETLILSMPRDILRVKPEKDCYFASRFYRALAIFLADRLRSTTRRATGAVTNTDELGADIMDNAALGARRFQGLIRNASLA